MSKDIQEFLLALDAINNNNQYSVLLPVSKNTLNFKPLNTIQFNKIISTIIYNNISDENITFNKVIIDVFKENIIEKDFNINSLSLLDKAFLILKTKQYCIKDEIVIFFTEDEIEEYNLLEKTSTTTITNVLENKNFSSSIMSNTIQDLGITITYGLPDILTEIIFDDYVFKLKNEHQTINSIFIEKMFLKEIAIFIKKIKAKESEIDLHPLNVEEKIQVIQQLPANVINELLKGIDIVKAPLYNLLETKVNVLTNDGQTITIVKEIPVDATIFNY